MMAASREAYRGLKVAALLLDEVAGFDHVHK